MIIQLHSSYKPTMEECNRTVLDCNENEALKYTLVGFHVIIKIKVLPNSACRINMYIGYLTRRLGVSKVW